MNLKARGELVTSVGLQKTKLRLHPQRKTFLQFMYDVLSVWTVFQSYDKQLRMQLVHFQSFDYERATHPRSGEVEWNQF